MGTETVKRSRRVNEHPPVHFVVVNDGNNRGDADAVRQAVPEKRPAGEASRLKTHTKT